MLDFTCSECRRLFHAKRADALTCSPRCRQRAKRRRDTDARARMATLFALHSATLREGIALKSIDAVRPELERIAAEIDALAT